MNLHHRIKTLEAGMPPGGCPWCAGRLAWLVDDLPPERREHPETVCPYCGTRHVGVRLYACDRATLEAV